MFINGLRAQTRISLSFQHAASNNKGRRFNGGGLDGPFYQRKMRTDRAARILLRGDFDARDAAWKHAGADVVVDCRRAFFPGDPRRPAAVFEKAPLGQRKPLKYRPMGVPDDDLSN
jgi:hypothetical protein